jgi:hypothetical protein
MTENKKLAWIMDHLNYPHDDYCLIIPFGRSRDGYVSFMHEGEIVKMHRHICFLVHGEPPTPEHHAAHSCGRGADGCGNPHHLRWKTPSENFKEGQKHPRRKLTPEQVVEIRTLKDLERVQDTAERFGVTECNIRKIQAGKLWRKERSDIHIFTDAEVRDIRAGTAPDDEVAVRYSVARVTIWRIRNRKSYRHVPA